MASIMGFAISYEMILKFPYGYNFDYMVPGWRTYFFDTLHDNSNHPHNSRHVFGDSIGPDQLGQFCSDCEQSPPEVEGIRVDGSDTLLHHCDLLCTAFNRKIIIFK
jgi:hypothetical protein